MARRARIGDIRPSLPFPHILGKYVQRQVEQLTLWPVGLIAARGELSEADVSAEDLLIASLRMRPDRIILGELRGAEAFTFLRAVNTGHPGSMTTIHADSPARAIEQLTLLVLQSGSRLSRDDVRHYVRESVDVFVQMARVDGQRRVTQILVAERG